MHASQCRVSRPHVAALRIIAGQHNLAVGIDCQIVDAAELARQRYVVAGRVRSKRIVRRAIAQVAH